MSSVGGCGRGGPAALGTRQSGPGLRDTETTSLRRPRTPEDQHLGSRHVGDVWRGLDSPYSHLGGRFYGFHKIILSMPRQTSPTGLPAVTTVLWWTWAPWTLRWAALASCPSSATTATRSPGAGGGGTQGGRGSTGGRGTAGETRGDIIVVQYIYFQMCYKGAFIFT